MGVGKLYGAVVRKESMDGERGGRMAANVLLLLLLLLFTVVSAGVVEPLDSWLFIDDLDFSDMSLELLASLALVLARFRLLLVFFGFDFEGVLLDDDDDVFMLTSAAAAASSSSHPTETEA